MTRKLSHNGRQGAAYVATFEHLADLEAVRAERYVQLTEERERIRA